MREHLEGEGDRAKHGDFLVTNGVDGLAPIELFQHHDFAAGNQRQNQVKHGVDAACERADGEKSVVAADFHTVDAEPRAMIELRCRAKKDDRLTGGAGSGHAEYIGFFHELSPEKVSRDLWNGEAGFAVPANNAADIQTGCARALQEFAVADRTDLAERENARR